MKPERKLRPEVLRGSRLSVLLHELRSWDCPSIRLYYEVSGLATCQEWVTSHVTACGSACVTLGC